MQYCNLMVEIVQNLWVDGESPLMPLDLVKPLVDFLTNMILECPQMIQQYTSANQLDQQMESSIIGCLMTLARRLCNQAKSAPQVQ